MGTTTMKKLAQAELTQFAPTLLYTAPALTTSFVGQMVINNKNGYRINPGTRQLGYTPTVVRAPDGSIYASIYLSGQGSYIVRVMPSGHVDDESYYYLGSSAIVGGMAIDSTGTYLYFTYTNSHQIKRLTLPLLGGSPTVTTIAGSGGTGSADHATGTSATFNTPYGLAIDSTDTYLYVCDSNTNKIRRVTLSGSFAVDTMVGSGTASETAGVGTAATINVPKACVLDSTNTYLYFTTTTGARVRRWTVNTTPGQGQCDIFAGSGTTTSTLDGTGTAANFNNPQGIGIASDGSYLVVYQSNNGNVVSGPMMRKITLPGAVVTTIGGKPGFQTAAEGYGTQWSTQGGQATTNMARWGSAGDDVFLFGDGNGRYWTLDVGNSLFRVFAGDNTVPATGGLWYGDWIAQTNQEIKLFVTSTTRGADKEVASITVTPGDTVHWQGSIPINAGEKLYAQCNVPGISVSVSGVENT